MVGFEVSPDQLIEFHTHGYLHVSQLLDAQEVSGLLHFSKSDSRIGSEAYARKDATGAETRLALRNELDDSSPYSAIARSHRVAGTMQRLLGDEIYHYHHKLMLKEPRVGGAWEWHQDYGYWYNFGCLYPEMGSCLIAIDRASRANGCLQVIRGSHKIGRIDHGTAGEQVGADMQRVSAALERLPLVYCEMEPGDGLFFHANLLHRSDQNTSDHPRWSLICCYNTRSNDPFIKNGRHPNYSPLEQWPDQRVHDVLCSCLAKNSS